MPRDVLPWGGEFSAARAPSGEATLRAPGLGTGPPFPRLLSFLTLSCRQRLREPGRRRARGQLAGGSQRARVLEAGPGGSDSARLRLPFGMAGSSAGAAGSRRRVRFLVERLVCRPPSTWAGHAPERWGHALERSQGRD